MANKTKEFIDYEKIVRKFSEKTYKKFKFLINEDDLERSHRGYHLDHIVSIKECFNNNLDPLVAASYHNLRMMYSKDNIRKNSGSDMTVQELMDKYNG